jgi:hypothetical protein
LVAEPPFAVDVKSIFAECSFLSTEHARAPGVLSGLCELN